MTVGGTSVAPLGGLRIFSVRGIPITVHVSWVAIYALITWTLAVGYFPHALPNLSRSAYWTSGLVAALLLFAAVLLHELSHALVAVAHGSRCAASPCTCSAACRTWKTSHPDPGRSS
jgi:Zn-dependent protease